MHRIISTACMPGVVILAVLAPALAQSSIDPDHKLAWGENVGWTNWLDANGGVDGVVVGATFLSGFVWGENVGWINLGDGSPANGVSYSNADGSDFGVNVSWPSGALSGLGWGENVGWVTFEGGALSTPAQPARIDCDGQFDGFVWSENGGWINLGDATHFVAVEFASENDCNSNGILDWCDPDCDGDGTIDDCDDDIDDDGILNEVDACDYTPPGAPIVTNPEDPLYGTLPYGDLDGDCDCDLQDFALMQGVFTGPACSHP